LHHMQVPGPMARKSTEIMDQLLFWSASESV
jgi:hypothetical protein